MEASSLEERVSELEENVEELDEAIEDLAKKDEVPRYAWAIGFIWLAGALMMFSPAAIENFRVILFTVFIATVIIIINNR